jgi:hypothetical protein
MGRPGARVARRKERRARIGFQHRVRRDDTMSWFKQRFDGIILVSPLRLQLVEVVFMFSSRNDHFTLSLRPHLSSTASPRKIMYFS